MDLQAFRRRASLSLDDGLEQEFLDVFFRQSLVQMRVALVLGVFLYAVFGFLDVIAAPAQRAPLWTIRYAIICPFLLLIFAFTFTDLFQRVAQPVMALMIVVTGSGIVAMTMITPAPVSYLYHAGLILVLMYAFGFARMRFVWATGACAAVVAIYFAVTTIRGTTPGWIVLNNAFFLIAAFILGGFACYSLERYARYSFLQRREITSRTEDLQTKNEELMRTNAELIESRKLIIESSNRAQFIFSALVDALPGTDLENKYRLEEKIGSGAFGTVYRARHLLLDAPVAVKVFRPASGKNMENSFERFRLEGISAKRINHPNAVTILDFGIASSAVAFLVMELLEGHTLAGELRERGRLTPRRCAEIAVPICSALTEAHSSGIIHRDIKPSNIFLHQSHAGEVVKVVDFGIAKLMESSVEKEFGQLTATGAFVGTPAYMAPERLTSQSYGASSDVYSVGVVLYEMLTGHVPHGGDDANHWRALLARMNNPVPAPNIECDMPAALSDLVVRAMALDPDARPTAYEMTRAIAELFSIPVPGPTLTGETPQKIDRRVSTEAETEEMHPTEVQVRARSERA